MRGAMGKNQSEMHSARATISVDEQLIRDQSGITTSELCMQEAKRIADALDG